ncbi:MAG TPA: N-acetylmuramoyl-L-alanine amidase [Leucothrix mucor]|uniref:N-acetylmuramoyl-L-alanine amidase n=1 Tax=Leucothrix mucor TaxID=45248 RepID=A0A7V2SYS2_LEUMU|nr:N-acetylmuramoyl-L-alanine amidase [Leucothrix mucor]
MRNIFLALILFIITIKSGFASSNWLSVKAKQGDHIASMLSRYHLQGSRCNQNQFYQLNRLNASSRLYPGRTYKLPILRYHYNGHSIRSTLSAINNTIDWKKALQIKNFNKRLHQSGLRRASFINNRDLWVSYQDIGCANNYYNQTQRHVAPRKKQISRAQKRNYFPIFGKKYAHVATVSNKLRGKVFYLVGGHGGPDPGAMAKRAGHTLCEDEYGYDVILRLARRLISYGAMVHIITRDPNDGIRDQHYLKCDTDEVYLGNKTIVRSQRSRLRDRAFIINKLFYTYKKKGFKSKDQITLMVHIDSRNSKKRIDVFFYHSPKSGRSKKVAKRLYRMFKSKYNYFQAAKLYTGRVISRKLFMLMHLKSLAVYFELANIRNTNDQKRIILPQNRELLAKWIADGLIRHYRR